MDQVKPSPADVAALDAMVGGISKLLTQIPLHVAVRLILSTLVRYLTPGTGRRLQDEIAMDLEQRLKERIKETRRNNELN